MSYGMSQPKKRTKRSNVIDDCMGEACGLPGYEKKKSGGYQSEFFGGLQDLGGIGNVGGSVGTPRNNGSDKGLQIQELGAEYNSRFGQIGSGFTESVDPYNIGFKDLLTGNNRTGEIISSGSGHVTGVRGRGRPRGSGKGSSGRKGARIETNIGKSFKVGNLRRVKPKEYGNTSGKTESRSIYQLLRHGKPKQPNSHYTVADIAKGRKGDLEQRQKLQEGLQREIEEQDEQPNAKFGKDD